MLGDPVPRVAEPLGVAHQIDRVAKCLPGRPTFDDRRKVENRDRQHASTVPALRLRNPLAVVVLVLLAPLRLVRLGLGELPLGARARLSILARRMLAGRRPATDRDESHDDERNRDDGKDEPRDHARTLPARSLVTFAAPRPGTQPGHASENRL